jgi:SP family arabinose:H+ symporter-like MFS transporter
MSALVAGLGGVLFGFDNIVISGAIRFLSEHFQLEPGQTGWAAGCAPLGCIIGTVCAGVTVDRFGLKRGLSLCAILLASSSIGVFASQSFVQFSIWRIVGGLGIGGASIISPMYIAEVAPTKHRGQLVTLYQLGIVVGILSAVVCDMLVQRSGSDAWNTERGWRIMFLAGIVPASVFALAIYPSLESHRWLMKVGRIEEANANLGRLNSPQEASQESNAILEALNVGKGSLAELLTTFRRPLLIGLMLAGLQQISGITPLANQWHYTPLLIPSRDIQSCRCNNRKRLSAIFSGQRHQPRCNADRAAVGGPRWPQNVDDCWNSVQAISFLFVGYLYHSHGSPISILAFVKLFVVGHAFGNGVAMWVIISEIYPTKVRGRAMSSATSMLWLVCYLENQAFPIVQTSIGPAGIFLLFAGGALMSIVLVAFLVPETKDRSLEEITMFWKGMNTIP